MFIDLFIMFTILVHMGWLWEALAGKLLIPGITFSWMAALSAALINCRVRADRIIESRNQNAPS